MNPILPILPRLTGTRCVPLVSPAHPLQVTIGVIFSAFLLASSTLVHAADRDRVENADYTKTVIIAFDGTTTTVTNDAGVTITYGATTAEIAVNSIVEGVEYILSGTSNSGYIQITSMDSPKVTLNGLTLTSPDGPALSMISTARNFIVVPTGTTNSLTDSATYTRTGSATIHASGPLVFSGKGALSVTGVKSHAIYGGTYIRCLGGDLTVPAAAKDAIHSKTLFQIDQGTLDLTATGDGIDGDSGSIVVNGGSISIRSTADDTKGIACDGDLTINGGSLNMTVSGTQSKAISCKSDLTVNRGTLALHLSGGVFLETITGTDSTYTDPSYCTALKCDGNLTVSGGSIAINHTGTAGKGLSADGNVLITGGLVDIATSGGPSASFTNSSGTLDMAAADCLKADGNLTITGGSITAASSGNAADAISCDGIALIGTLGNDTTPVISANTTGSKILLSGSGNNADYVNAKAFKAGGNLTMNGGIFRATTTKDGGEGMESKATLTINGGLVEISSYDDCINASTRIAVTGGTIYCYSSNNDGIDSNGTFAFSGGTIISSGSNSPEEGFDCDNNNFAITGGTLIGTGGATSSPTAASSSQNTVIYRGTGTANAILVIKSTNGNQLIYRIPRTYSGSMTLLFSAPAIATGTTYTLVSGATVTGGTEFHGYTTGGTVTGGTTLKTFTPTARVTTVQ